MWELQDVRAALRGSRKQCLGAASSVVGEAECLGADSTM